MPQDSQTTPILPAHIEDTIRSIAELHAAHHRGATALERAAERMTRFLGRPRFIGLLTASVGGWVVVNLVVQRLGFRAFDPPPFAWLEFFVSLVSLYMVVLVLTTQRRDDQLAQHREQLTLELAILSEAKTAKIIELLEAIRRDSPHLPDRHDEEAAAMAAPADPQSVLDAIKHTHAEAELSRGSDQAFS
jgi:uncharacterized membrane protein